MLYGFEELKKKLDEWGYPTVETSSAFQIIKGVNFKTAYHSGDIFFESDGIYLRSQGKSHRGYMFLKEYQISKYKKLPKFHLLECNIIKDFIKKGTFKERYEWSNSNVNDVEDRDTGKIHKDSILECCGYCRQLIRDSIHTTEDFFKTLSVAEIEESSVRVDIFGYVRGKEVISKRHKEKKNYTCELCQISPKQVCDRRFWHTHHKDGKKVHNEESNLMCLCILCHSFTDSKHKENFQRGTMKVELKSFVRTYYSELERLGNPYLLKFVQKNH